MTDLREHGSKDDPNYYEYHPDAGPHNLRANEPAFGDRVAADREWNAPYDEATSRAINDYTGVRFSDINSYMRGQKPGTPGYMAMPGPNWLDKRIALMKEALRPSPQPMDLVRGTAFTAFGSLLPDKEFTAEATYEALKGRVGEVFSDPAFLSTSWGSFAKGYGDSEARLFLRAPVGTLSINTQGEAVYEDEREVILAPGTKWRLDGVTKKARGLDVHGTVVP